MGETEGEFGLLGRLKGFGFSGETGEPEPSGYRLGSFAGHSFQETDPFVYQVNGDYLETGCGEQLPKLLFGPFFATGNNHHVDV